MPVDVNGSGRGICFVATGRSGLGHLRRVSTIARALRPLVPDSPFDLVTNASPQGLEPADLAVFDRITLKDRAEMADAIARGRAGLAVFDTIEVPQAEHLPQKLALILRETSQDRLARFGLRGGRRWDALLVPNPAHHWMPDATLVAAKLVLPLGWIYRQPGVVKQQWDGPPTLLVATGGGGTQETADALYPVIDRTIEAARLRARQPVRVVQAVGPRARVFGTLQSADEVFDPGGALNRYFASADIVISTAGYNSVLELALTESPTLLYPIPRSLDDQAQRVRQWGEKLGMGYDPERPDQAAKWLADKIVNPCRRRTVDLGPGGEGPAAHLLSELLR